MREMNHVAQRIGTCPVPNRKKDPSAADYRYDDKLEGQDLLDFFKKEANQEQQAEIVKHMWHYMVTHGYDPGEKFKDIRRHLYGDMVGR